MSDVAQAWPGRIRARICRRDIADEPVARIATLTRIGRDFFGSCVITDGGRLESESWKEVVRLHQPRKWVLQDLNLQPIGYEPTALAFELST